MRPVAAYLRSLDPRLPRPVYVLELGALVNAFGNGVVLPFLLIYLHNVRGIPFGLAGTAEPCSGRLRSERLPRRDALRPAPRPEQVRRTPRAEPLDVANSGERVGSISRAMPATADPLSTNAQPASHPFAPRCAGALRSSRRAPRRG